MQVQVNMACLLTQPQQKLQINYKTTITQNHQKIELYEKPTTTELKKSHSSRQVGGADIHKDTEWAVPRSRAVDKSGGIPWERGIPAPHQITHPRVPVPGR